MRRTPRALALAALVLAPTLLAGCTDFNPGNVVVGQRWPLEATGIAGVLDSGATGRGVKVAIVDTGIKPDHPEFDGVAIVAWKDYVTGRADPYDDNGHGTHVAGIIAAQGTWGSLTQGFRIRGAAPDVSLIIIKAISANGRGEEADVARGIDYAVETGADVLVLSLGGGTFPILGSETERAVDRAVGRGVLVVAAAGNAPKGESDCAVTSPAIKSFVIAVGAVDEYKRVANFSCEGRDNDPNALGLGGRSDPHKKPELVAPGVNILSAWNGGVCGGSGDNDYCQASGTSQATPYVGAALAIILDEHPELRRQNADTVVRIKDVLMASAEKVGPLAGRSSNAHDDEYGYGLLRVDEALRALG